jgi:hypothetical protein
MPGAIGKPFYAVSVALLLDTATWEIARLDVPEIVMRGDAAGRSHAHEPALRADATEVRRLLGASQGARRGH